MIQQVVKVASDRVQSITVLCDNTYVFILLVYHFIELQLHCSLTMESTSSGRVVIDIGTTARKHEGIVRQPPAAHALSGCDTVAQLWGRRKGTAVKALEADHSLRKFGEVDVCIEVVAEATAFIVACCGSKKRNSVPDVRKDVCATKMGKPKVTTTPNLKVLPPATEAFEQNVRRAHIQTAIWKSAVKSEPPTLDPTKYGWARDEASRSLIPIVSPLRCLKS